jgi:outer membrane autotransporter protein
MLGSLNLTTSSLHSINANVGSRLFDLRGGALGVNVSGLSFDKIGGGSLPGTLTSFASPPEWGGGASADSSSILGKFGIFANGQGSFGDQGATSREPGFDFHTAGVSVGGDYRFTDSFISGMAFGYLRTKADFHSSAGDFTSDAYSLSAYGTYYIFEKLYIDGIVTYGWNTYDTERNVANTGSAKGRTAGTHLSPSVSVGYNFNIGALTFGPTGRVEYVRVDINAFREHGADPFNLSIRSQKIESVTTALGGQVMYAISTPWGVLLPLVRSEWVHEYKGDSRQLIGGFTVDPATLAANLVSNTVFAVQTTSPNRDYCNLGAGLSATFKSGVSAFVYYEAALGRTNFTDNTFHAGVRVEF